MDPARPLAVVTGASSGIGLELARELAARGHDVVVCAENDALPDAVAAVEAAGGSAAPLQADLATPDGLHALVAHVRALGRPVDVLALNAGVGVHGPFLETALDDELRLIALNVTSTVHLAKHLLPDMVARGAGRVLVTASIAAQMPGTYAAVYNASKAFDLQFAEALRDELRDTGVTVTALMPGPTDTEFFERAGMEDTRVGAGPKADPALVARQGLDALFDGKDHVVGGGLKTKLQSALAEVTPEPVKAAQHRRMAEPGSGDDA